MKRTTPEKNAKSDSVSGVVVWVVGDQAPSQQRQLLCTIEAVVDDLVDFMRQQFAGGHRSFLHDGLDHNVKAVDDIRLVDIGKTNHLDPEMSGDGKHGLEYMPGGCSTKRIIQNQDTAQLLRVTSCFLSDMHRK